MDRSATRVFAPPRNHLASALARYDERCRLLASSVRGTHRIDGGPLDLVPPQVQGLVRRVGVNPLPGPYGARSRRYLESLVRSRRARRLCWTCVDLSGQSSPRGSLPKRGCEITCHLPPATFIALD